MKFLGCHKLFCEGCISQRYVVTLMSFLGVVIAYILRSCISIAITRMSPLYSDDQGYQDEEVFDWDERTQGFILSSFYYGYALAHIPSAFFVRWIGGKHTMGLGVLLSSLLSALSPLAARNSPEALIASRFFMGLVEGPTFPALCEILSQWAPPTERTLLSAVVFAGVQIGTVLSLSLGGYILSILEWPYLFYIMGGVGTFWYLIWMILCYNKPSEHPFISTFELDFLTKAISQDHRDMATPWRELLHSKPLWALIIAQFGHDYGLFTMVSDLPKYYQDVGHYEVTKNGILSSLPYLVMWITSVLLGFVCDKLINMRFVTITHMRRNLATIGALVPGVGMVLASYMTNTNSVVTLVTISMAFMGFCYASLRVNPLDLSSNHSAVIMAIVNGSGAVAGLIAPSMVGVFVHNNENRTERIEGWQNVFWVVFVFLLLTNFPFMCFGSGSVQPWNEPEEPLPRSDLRRRSTLSGGEPIREKYKNYYPAQPSISE